MMTTKAEELWTDYVLAERAAWHPVYVMSKPHFLAALAEYGASVRARDAEIARDCEARGVACSAAISREPL